MFEKQKEISMLHEQKVVRQGRAFHESCLKQARKNSQIEIGKRAKSTDSGIDIIEVRRNFSCTIFVRYDSKKRQRYRKGKGKKRE